MSEASLDLAFTGENLRARRAYEIVASQASLILELGH